MMISLADYPELSRAVQAGEKSLSATPTLATLFRRCYLNTLETTIQPLDDGTTFVITGDIPAMWLRDSAAQVRPYVRFAGSDPVVAAMVRGVIARQARYLNIDPYANAFNRAPDGSGHQDDRTAQNPWLWERKYELDSLCYPVQLIQDYWHATGDTSVFTDEVRLAFNRILEVIECEQHHDRDSTYAFERLNCPPSDTLPFDGRGTRTNFTGMSWSGFRPSDDACKFGYLIPSNMFAVVILNHMAAFARTQFQDAPMAARAERLRDQIDFGIQTYGIVQHPRFGAVYAYEVDGYGNVNLMDDANVPSLLSIPYLGYRPASDPIYQNTRRFVLSSENPYYFTGSHAHGVGSPHTPHGYIWHMALIMQALTALDSDEESRLIDMIANTTGGTGLMHESFNPDVPTEYTRSWFAWANSLFGELLLTRTERRQVAQKAGIHGR
ncbi:MAG: glycoside hydrolase family 125 protein [bacterium]|nr:glycoside hydrolase family 125 protein [bacterium]